MSYEPRTHLIWSGHHLAWWRPDERGYTTELSEAGWYTRTKAEGIERRSLARGEQRSRAVPVAYLAQLFLHGRLLTRETGVQVAP